MIIENKNFNLEQIYRSGQCLRMKKTGDNIYSIIANGEILHLKQLDNDRVEFIETTDLEFDLMWKDYFDLDFDYQNVIDSTIGTIHKCCEFGSGLRILNQDTWEVLASTIISKHVEEETAKQNIEKLCQEFGRKKWDSYYGEHYYTFPSAYILSLCRKGDLDFLGQKEEILLNAALIFHTWEISRLNIRSLNTNVFRSIPGITRKDAVNIKLFGCSYKNICYADIPTMSFLQKHFEDVPSVEETFEFLGVEKNAGLIQFYIKFKELNGNANIS